MQTIPALPFSPQMIPNHPFLSAESDSGAERGFNVLSFCCKESKSKYSNKTTKRMLTRHSFMKYFLIFLALTSINLKAQTALKFDKRFVQCEDKWVAFQMDKDSSYLYGFIYIDRQAGLTLNYEGNFKTAHTGKFAPRKLDSTNVKIRLQPNNVLVAIIPPSKFGELQIEATPKWLKYYKTDTASIERLYQWGFLYNGWGECAKAMTYLKRAQTINPNFKGLSVELAYSYNCLRQYDSAILVLKNALEVNPRDAYTNKELIYAQIKSGRIEEAAESCKKALEICTDKTYNGENCFNLLQGFYVKKDKRNFDLWLGTAKKWTSDNAVMKKNIKTMQKELRK
jgi:tetratricopeptide (TPR) repeat protein